VQIVTDITTRNSFLKNINKKKFKVFYIIVQRCNTYTIYKMFKLKLI